MYFIDMYMDIKEFFFNPEAIKQFGVPKMQRHRKKEKKQITQPIIVKPVEIKDVEDITQRIAIVLKSKLPISAKQIVTKQPGKSEKIEKVNMTDFKLTSVNFHGCIVKSSEIEGMVIPVKRLAKILREIFEFLNDVDLIKENSKIRIVDGKVTEKGFVPYENLGISVQGANANQLMREIFTHVLKNNITFQLNVLAEGSEYQFINVFQ